MKTRTGQGITAFLVGTAMFFVLGIILSGFPDVAGFLFNNRMYIPRGFGEWTDSVVAWNYASNILAGILLVSVITTVVAAAIILVFRLIGLRPKWPAIKGVFIWAIIANALVLLFSYAQIYLIDDRSASIWLQTGVAYLQIVSLGLPYTFAWLMATRKAKI
jgi:hypothetical protein